MTRIEDHIEIDAAPANVFRFCHNPDHRADWDERVTRVEVLTPEPVRRGTLIRVDAARSGKFVFSWDAEYSEFQFPSSSKVKVLDAAPSSSFGSGTETWEFSSMGGGGTRFTLVWEYKPRGFIARIMDVLGRRAATRRAIRRSLANLKDLVEAR
jgi:uncharacterized protein YndB with AHSA1/START domain